MSNPTYEFTPEQNLILGRLASRMRIVGAALIVVALLSAAESLVLLAHGSGGMLGIEIGAILLLIGVWSVRAGAEFREVAGTQGADIAHLMNAIREIRKLYELQFWALLVVAILLSLGLIAVLAGPARLPAPLP